jgi:predicted RNA methylase
MTTVEDHYETHLAPVYLWMSGGVEAALARGDAEITALLPHWPRGTTAVDLGAGFGMHAIPLARHGCSVVALDTSTRLLDELRRHAAGLPVNAIRDDLLSFQRHVNARLGLIMIMGDTLTHLPDRSAVLTLVARAAESLGTDGRFIATFRDYTSPLTGAARFIPVRSDADRILTCFLEYGDDHVEVHDLLHERQGSVWQLKVSTYRKLRLSPAWLAGALRDSGFFVQSEPGPSGMVRLIATRR